MKLADHVDSLRGLIESAFDKQFARLGFGKSKQIDSDKLPEDIQAKRQRFVAMLENHIGETGCYESAREKLIDELTFTLFNRLAAIKVMEAASLFPPILTKQKEHGDRSFGHKAWLEINPHMREEELDGIRDYVKVAFDELGQTLTLYSKAYPYALLPDAISLNDIIDAFNAVEQDTQVGSEIWLSDDVLGWMYESYNNSKKEEFKRAQKEEQAKVEYNKVSLQSQVYTPRWVVQFLIENSLGKLYLEMYPDSEIKRRYKIANVPESQTRTIKPLHEVRTIDPACGSGNFLLYAFDFYYELYLDQIENYDADYEKKDIPKLIIENNLHGIDLDDRAVQLAQLGLYIKAKKKRRSIGELNFRVVSSDFYLPEFSEVKHIFEQGAGVDNNQKELIEKIWNDLKYAYKFGSLVHIDEQLNKKLHAIEERAIVEKIDTKKKIVGKVKEADLFATTELAEHKDFSENFFANLTKTVEQYARTGSNTFLTSKTRDAITFLELLTTKYDVATANPPYTDDRDFGPDLKEFLDENYQKPLKFNTNLFATFVKRTYEFISDDGLMALVHPPTFMYIKSFSDLRKLIIENTHINIFVEWGYLGMFNPTARVDSAFYVLEKRKKTDGPSTFIKLNHLYETKRYEALFDAYNSYFENENHALLYSVTQSKLKAIKSWPFIYWISDDFRQKFQGEPLSEYYDVCNGISSGGNNERFYRYWWEVSNDEILGEYNPDSYKWATINKGGDYQKWYGNLWLVFKWKNNGEELKALKRKCPSIRYSYDNYYFKEGLAFSGSTSKGLSVRYQPKFCIFERSGKSIFGKDQADYFYLLALLNSKIAFYIADCLNPTVSIQSGDIERIPYIVPEKSLKKEIEALALQNVELTKRISSFRIYEPTFTDTCISPLFKDSKSSVISALNKHNYYSAHCIVNEASINEKIYQVYNLSEHDKQIVVAKEGESIGGLPVTSEARNAYLAETEATKEFPLDAIREFIEVLPTKEFTAEERELIENGFGSLYQSNNDLEEFCIRHQVNPINICDWFKQSNVIPQQRMHMLAMEFLADMVREILMEDEDGIIPLVPNAGEKVLLDRIEEKFREKGFNSAQYSSFDSILGRPIHEYLNKYFFAELSNHLNMFPNLPKTPFIWHLTSGPEQGFDCYIIIYKWSRDNLMRLRSVYIENRERALVNRQSDIANNTSAEAQNEKDRIFKQLKEIETFKKKIDELLTEGYNPILDDGVGKNIAPLQKKKMLPYDVLNEGQLKKYLNADW